MFLTKYPLVDRYDFYSLRKIICGTAPILKHIAHDVQTSLGLNHIINGYGMTELTAVTLLSDPKDEDCVGMSNIVHGMFSKVVDPETHETLDVGQVGEVCFKSEQVMMGYWDNPEATKRTIDEDGWLRV